MSDVVYRRLCAVCADGYLSDLGGSAARSYCSSRRIDTAGRLGRSLIIHPSFRALVYSITHTLLELDGPNSRTTRTAAGSHGLLFLEAVLDQHRALWRTRQRSLQVTQGGAAAACAVAASLIGVASSPVECRRGAWSR